MTKLSSLLTIGLFSLLLIACKTKVDNKTSQKENDLEDFKKAVNEIKPNLKNVEGMGAMLSLSGADFNPHLIVDPTKWEANVDNDAALAANMGIYIVDGFYQMAYEKKKEAYLSFMAGKSIAAKLDAIDIFDAMVLNKLDEGVVPEGEVLATVGNILNQSEEVFGEKDAYRLFSAFIIGAYIEKEYILFDAIFNQPAKFSDEEKLMLSSRLIIIVGEQLKQLPALIKIVEEYKTEDDPGILYNDLLGLEEMRQELISKGSKVDAKPEDIYRNAKLKEMHEKLNEMRGYLVKDI